MIVLIDTSPTSLPAKAAQISSDCGQLVTPLTNNRIWDGVFAADNGGYTGFKSEPFMRLLGKIKPHK